MRDRSSQVFEDEMAILVTPSDTLEEILKKSSQVRPSKRQLLWQETEFNIFVHFGLNTFTNSELGSGKEDPSIFNPVEFDAQQWAKVAKEAGAKMLVLTAKHHDGFCLWPSDYTEFSVKNSPWKNGKGDIVEEVADACKREGLKFGIYLSPWDRHEVTYGTEKYNEYFKNQLRELLTRYGKIAEVWLDGFCGEGPNGKKQIYDWEGYWQLIRELQPEAVISVCGPDVRWCGNEEGRGRESEWSVVFLEEIEEGNVIKAYERFFYGPNARCLWEDMGSKMVLSTFVGKKGRLVWYPSEVDVSIRPGWFYHPEEDDKVKSVEHLLNIYFESVGKNAVLLLNVPPTKNGLIHENDAKRLRELGNILRKIFSNNLAKGAKVNASSYKENNDLYHPSKTLEIESEDYWTPQDNNTSAWIEYDLGSEKNFNIVMIQEQIKLGQRIEKYSLEVWDAERRQWSNIASGTTIGYKRLVRVPEVRTNKVRLNIIESRDTPTVLNFGLFKM
jgi:alpha-L-fucosidase